MRRYQAPDPYDEVEEPDARWSRERPDGGRRWVRIALFLFIIPLLLGAGVAFFAGRPIAFDAIRRITDHKFPNGRWVDGAELVRWRADLGRARPVVLDARTADEYAVSHLDGAVRIDPYKPSLRPLRGFPKDTAIVLYSSVGYRGARVANFLERQGYTEVYNLEGGQFKWANAGRPVYRQGSPTADVHPYNATWGLLLESKYRIKAPPIPKQSAAP